MTTSLSRADRLRRLLHLSECDKCRSTAYVWYLREWGVEPLPPGRRDRPWVWLRHRLGWDRPK